MDLSLKNLINKFIGVWKDGENTSQQFVRGSVLSIFSRIIIKSIQFFRAVILARLLFPTDFGLFGMASIVISATEVFSQTGFSSAIIHEKENVKNYLNSVWTVNFIRNIFLGFLVYFGAAPLASIFFHNAVVIPLAKALSLTFFLMSFYNIGVVLLDKEMQYNKITLYNIICVVAEVITVVISALILRNVWALVFGVIANRLMAVIFSYYFHPFRPKFTLDLSGARRLFKYGKWVSLAGIIAFLVGQGDNITIGRLLAPDQLGYYLIAFSFGTLPAIEIARVLGNVLFPLFSKIQQDKERLRRTFIRVARIIFSLTIPASVGLFVLAREAVHFVYSDRWLAVVPILYVIILYSFLKSFELVENSLFLGVGKPKTNSVITIIQIIVMFSVIVPLTKIYGPVGTAWSVFVGSVVAQIYALYVLRHEIILGVKGFVRMVSLPVVASLIMFSILYLSKMILPVSNVILLLLYILAGAGIYFFIVLKLDKVFGGRFIHSLELIKKYL